jgi:hypothetical protein
MRDDVSVRFQPQLRCCRGELRGDGKVAVEYRTERHRAADCERLWPSAVTQAIRAQVKGGK